MTSDKLDINQGLSLIKTYTLFQSIIIRCEMPNSMVVNVKHLGIVVKVKHLGTVVNVKHLERISLGSNSSNTPC